MKKPAIKTQLFGKTETFTVRISKKTKYHLELLGRKQKRNMSKHGVFLSGQLSDAFQFQRIFQK